jgi:hypothetical protein
VSLRKSLKLVSEIVCFCCLLITFYLTGYIFIRWRRSLKTDRHGSGIAGAFKRWVQSRLEKEEQLSSCTHRLKRNIHFWKH